MFINFLRFRKRSLHISIKRRNIGWSGLQGSCHKKNLAGSKCPLLALRFIAASSEGRLFYCLSLVVVVSFFSGSWEQSFDSVLDDESELRVRGEG